MKAQTHVDASASAALQADGSSAAQDEISRLKHANAINSEIAASLRAQREHDQRRSSEQAALLCSVAEQLQREWDALNQVGTSAARRASTISGDSGALLEDLRDYMRACSGALALESEPVHLGTFVRQIVAQACAARGVSAERVAVSIPQHVPERVRTDVRCFSRVLLQFFGMALDRSEGRALSLQIHREGWDLAPAECVGTATVIALTTVADTHDRPQLVETHSAASALRDALATRLREVMGASLREEPANAEFPGWYLTLPLEVSVDPARANELERANADQHWMTQGQGAAGGEQDSAGISGEAANGAVDFLYLDRQLGSLAQLVLARTAPAFLELADDRLTSLVVAHEMADLDRIRNLAQVWKASAMTVGARQLAELLGTVEKQAAAGHLPGQGTMRPIWDALKQLERALRQICAAAVIAP